MRSAGRVLPPAFLPAPRRRLPKAVCSGDSPLRVLVTGSTKGLGLALANAFLENNAVVHVSSRDPERVATTLASLRATHGHARVFGLAADVSRAADVERLASHAVEALGGIDVWIANAGGNAYTFKPLVEQSPEAVEEIVTTNLLGTLLCARTAATLMLRQPKGGVICLLEGAGSDGGQTRLYAAYGASKAALRQLAASLTAELKETRVRVLSISPGMVQTELIAAGRDAFGSTGRFFVNVMAESPDVVAKQLVTAVRNIAVEGEGGRIEVLTPLVAARKLLSRLLLGTNKNRWYEE